MTLTDMFLATSKAVVDKTASVEAATNTKIAAFHGPEILMTLEQFRVANPQADALDERLFLSKQGMLNQGVGADINTDLDISVDNLQKTLYGAAGLFGDAIDSETISDYGWEGVAAQQAEISEAEQDYSLGLQRQKADIVESAKQREVEREAERGGPTKLTSDDVLSDFLNTVGDYATNPRAALSGAVQSSMDLLSMVATGGVAGATAKAATKHQIKKRLGEEALKRASVKKIADKAVSKAVSKAAGRTAMLHTGIIEGTSNAIQTRDVLMALDESTLSGSEDFKMFADDMRKEDPDITFEEVKAQFVEEGTRDTAVISGVLAAAIGKLTGATDLFGKATVAKGLGKKGIIKATVKGLATEAVEETLQSGMGELVSNIQIKKGDVKKDILEGVGAAAGAGAVTGALAGGVVSGTGATVSKVKDKIIGKAEERRVETLRQTIPEPEEPKEKEEEKLPEPKNVVEEFAPEREPVQDGYEEAVKTKKVIDTYLNYKADDPDVKAYVDEVVSHTLGADLSEESLRTNTDTIEEIGEVLMNALDTNIALTLKGNELLGKAGLSKKDTAAIEDLAVGMHPEVTDAANYNTVSKILATLELPETEELINSLVAERTAKGEDADAASRDELLSLIGDVILYSEDKVSKLSGESLLQLAEVTADDSKKKLFELVAALKGAIQADIDKRKDVPEGAEPRQETGAERVRNELLGGGGRGKSSIGRHVQTFLEAIGEGDTETAQKTYDNFIGYLVKNQKGKLRAIEEFVATSPKLGEKTEWDTSGPLSKIPTSREFTFEGAPRAGKYIREVKEDLVALEHIDALAQDVLKPTEVEPETTTAPVESPGSQEVDTKVEPEATLVANLKGADLDVLALAISPKGVGIHAVTRAHVERVIATIEKGRPLSDFQQKVVDVVNSNAERRNKVIGVVNLKEEDKEARTRYIARLRKAEAAFEAERKGHDLAEGEWLTSNKKMPTQKQMDEADNKFDAAYEPKGKQSVTRLDKMFAAIKREGRENVIQGKDFRGDWYFRIRPPISTETVVEPEEVSEVEPTPEVEVKEEVIPTEPEPETITTREPKGVTHEAIIQAIAAMVGKQGLVATPVRAALAAMDTRMYSESLKELPQEKVASIVAEELAKLDDIIRENTVDVLDQIIKQLPEPEKVSEPELTPEPEKVEGPFTTTSKVLHSLVPEDILTGDALTKPEVVKGVSELLGVPKLEVALMSNEEVLRAILDKVGKVSFTADPELNAADKAGIIINAMVTSGMVTMGNRSVWFNYYKMQYKGVPFTTAQEERTQDVLDSYSKALEEEAAELDGEVEKASLAASESFDIMNGIASDSLPRPEGSVSEQKQKLNTNVAFKHLGDQIRSLKGKQRKLTKDFEKALKTKGELDPIIAEQSDVKDVLIDLINERIKARKKFNKARGKYLKEERIRQKLIEIRVAKVEIAKNAKKGKAFYDPEAATRSQHARINSITEVIGVAKYNLDILAKAIGMKVKVLKAIVKGDTDSTLSISRQIAEEINVNILPDGAAKSTTEAYIQSSTFALGSLVENTHTGPRGGKKRLGVRTYAAFKAMFDKKFPVIIGTLSNTHAVKRLLDSMVDDSPLKTSLSSFKESAIWDMGSVLNLAQTDKEGIGVIARKYSTTPIKILNLLNDYNKYKIKFISKIQAMGSEVGGTKLLNSMLLDKEGNVIEHFVQASFLSFGEVMEFIGDRPYLPAKQLKIYVDGIERGNTDLRNKFVGKGTFIPTVTLEGIMRRNVFLIEGYDQNQYLPALNTFLNSVVVNILTETVKVSEVKHNKVTYYGYTRKKVANSALAKGDNSLLKAEYGSIQSRTNHIGIPPNTDYSYLSEAAREMAEITESVPFFMDMDKFSEILKISSKVNDKNEKFDLNATVTEFAEIYLHQPTEKEIDALNVNDQLSKRGKKEGIKAEFINAYSLYERLKDESVDGKPVPIYYSSNFILNGRQMFEGEVNPQSNKFHRILVRTSFDKSSSKVHGSLEQLTKAVRRKNSNSKLKFYVLALGVGLGVSLDKQKSNAVSLKESLIALKKVDDAIKESGKQNIPDFLAWQREHDDNYKVPTVEYIEALDSIFNKYIQKPLPIKVDGKTNGAFHTNWLYAMGVKDTGDIPLNDLLAMGGLKNSIDAPDTHQDAIEADTYYATSGKTEQMFEWIQSKDTPIEWHWTTKRAWSFLRYQLEGISIGDRGREELDRNASKPGVTASVYGGSLNAISNGLVYGAKAGEGYLTKFYADASAASKPNATKAEINQFFGWNKVFAQGKNDQDTGNQLSREMDIKAIKEYTITPEQLEDLKEHVKDTIGTAINMSINGIFSGSKDVTGQITNATGTMVALYNMAQIILTQFVLKKRSLPAGASLSKEDISKIKQSLADMFPAIELSIEGSTFLTKRDNRRTTKAKGTSIPVFAVKGNSLTANPKSVRVGVAPLEEVGVSATPNGIISVDAETMRMVVKLMKAVTGTLQLNVFDAVDIASNADTPYGALITNLAETMTIMTADPVKKVADTLTGVLEAAGKPLKFEGDIIVTGLNSLLESGTKEFTADYLTFINELDTELGGRSSTYMEANLLGTTDISDYLQKLNQSLNTTAIQGEKSRLEYIANSDGGIKVHQLAGVDGTGTLINTDGSIAWSQMKEESGITDKQLKALKQLPDVIKFEKGLVKRVANRDQISLDVPLLKNIQEAPNVSDEVNLFSTLAGKIFSKGTLTNRSKKEGYTEIKLTKALLKDPYLAKVNLVDSLSLKTTLLGSRRGTPSNLVGQKIRFVDKNSLKRFGLTGSKEGSFVIEENDEGNKEKIIYVREGISIADVVRVVQHELTHANIAEGLATLIYQRKGTKAQIALLIALEKDMETFMEYVSDSPEEDAIYNTPAVRNLQLELKNIKSKQKSGLKGENNTLYEMIQEYVAYLNQDTTNTTDTGFAKYLSQTISGEGIVEYITAILTRLSDILFSLVGRSIPKASIPEENDSNVTRIMLLQAFITEMGKGGKLVNSPAMTINSTDRVNNQFNTRDYTVEQSARLVSLQTKVDKSIQGLGKRIADVFAKEPEVRTSGLKVSATKAHKDFIKFGKVQADSVIKLKRLSAMGALQDSEVALLANLTAILALGKNQKYYRGDKLDKLYMEARKSVKVSDLVPEGIHVGDPSYISHLQMASEVYTLIFNTNDSNRVARFAAYSEVSPELQTALKKISMRISKPTGLNWFETLRHTIRDLVTQAAHKLSGITARNANRQTQLIVNQIVEDKRLFDKKYANKLAKLEASVNTPIKYIVRQSVDATRRSISFITGYDIPEGFSISDELQNYSGGRTAGEPAGFWRSTMMEFFPRDTVHSQIADRSGDIHKSNVDAEHTGTVRGVKESLADIFSKELSKKESAAIIDGDIKGDLSSLVQEHGFSIDEVRQFLQDSAFREGRINVLQNQILATRITDASFASKSQLTMMINEAKALGHRMVQGGATHGMNYPNAFSISRLTGSKKKVRYSERLDSELVPMLDKLASISAIQYMDSGTRDTLGELYASEGDAFNAIHLQVKATKNDLVKRYGVEVLNQLPKGSTPDITDVNKSIKIIPRSQLKEFPTYVKLHEVNVTHTNEPHYIIYDDVGGAVPYVAGAISLIDSSLNQARKGVVRAEGIDIRESGDITKYNSDRYSYSLGKKIFEPVAMKDGGFTPNLNKLGYIVGYKYEIPRAEFKKLLGVDADWKDMLSEHAGRIRAEDLGKRYNKVLVKELAEVYHTAKPHEKKSYVRISKDSPNKQVREAWELIPYDMKQEAKIQYGEPILYVHRDDINQVIGFREASIKNLFRPELYDKKSNMKLLSKVLTKFISPKVISYLRKGELLTQELTTMAKDLIVVKSGIVPAENILSNINQLSLRGIPMEGITSGILLGINAKRGYDETTNKIDLLRAKIKVAKDADKKALRNEFRILKQVQKDNPLYRLIVEEGLNPSVIEELGEESKRDGMRKKFFEKVVEGVFKDVPQDNLLVDIGKEVIITQDSSTYKLLNEGLELGDFVSKFVLYTHLTEVEGISHELAVEQARSEFINYNRNQNKALDYFNKTGGMSFFKYFMRKHPIIINSIKKNPSRALVQGLSILFLGAPSIYETSLLNKDLSSATGFVDLVDMASGAHPYF